MGYALFVVMLAAALLFIVFGGAASEGAAEGLRLFASSVLPCLFPFMVCGRYFSYVIRTTPRGHSGKDEKKRTSALRRALRGLAEAAVCAVCGIPTAAVICSDKCLAGLKPRRASALCAIMSTVNPAFIIGFAASGLLKRPAAWPVLAAAHYLPALAGAVIFAASDKSPRGDTCPNALPAPSAPNGAAAVASALSEAVSAVTRVGGAIVFFAVIIAVVKQSGLFTIMGEPWAALAAGTLEMTNGLKMLCGLGFETGLLAALMSFFMSFGGVCVYMQSALFFKELRPLPYFAAKLGMGAASFVICLALNGLFPESAAVMAEGGETLGLIAESSVSRGVMLLYAGLSLALAGAASYLYSRLFIRRRVI